MKFKTYKMQLYVVSPVHIGCGDDYEPYNYVVKNSMLHIINESKFIEIIREKGKFKDFLKVCETGSIMKIRKFIYDSFHPEVILYSVPVSEEFENIYNINIAENNTNEQNVINQLLAHKTLKNSYTFSPIIPGSEIKGAIRTAILDRIAKIKSYNQRVAEGKDDRKLQGYLLNYLNKRGNPNVTLDPLKYLKISDFTLVEGGTFIDKVTNIQKFGEDRNKVPQFLELIKPGSIFEGTIAIEEEKLILQTQENKKEKITLNKIIQFVKEHFIEDVLKKESKWFNYKDSALAMDYETDFILKLGMHTGAYAMTISEYRNITLKFGKNFVNNREHQTTTWKSNKLNMPLGWVMLSEKGVGKFKEKLITKKGYSENFKPATSESISKLKNRFGG